PGTAGTSPQHTAHGSGVGVPRRLLLPQGRLPLLCQMVVPPWLPGGGLPLIGGDQALLLPRVEQGVQRPRPQVEHVLRPRLQLAGHLIAVLVPVLQQLQDQHRHAAADQALVRFHTTPPYIDILYISATSLYIGYLYKSRKNRPGLSA